MEASTTYSRISLHPGQMGGVPRIRRNYPELTDEDIRAAIEYAREVVQDEEILVTAGP